MSQRYDNVEMIKELYRQVLGHGKRHGFDTDNIKIHLHPEMADALNLGDCLFVGKINIPIVRNDAVSVDKALDNGQFSSDIYVGVYDED